MPIYQEVLADIETPLGAYWKLAHDQVHSFLLESVTGGETLARYSVLGVRPRAVVRSKGNSVRRITAEGETSFELAPGQDPLDVLKDEMGAIRPIDMRGMPAFIGGAVGMLGYDIVRFFERLPDSTEDDLQADDMAMMLADTVVVFDHAKNLMRVIVTADGSAEAYDRAAEEIDWVLNRLRQPMPGLPGGRFEEHPVESTVTRERYEEMVRRVIEYVSAGDGIQMVLSQRFSTKIDAHPLTLYRALRSINPSPYMFLLRFGDFDLVGASPEILVSLHDDVARVRPIAGTRWRGETPEEDAALERELLADEKERAEHIMLVDLGRNDLGRVCKPGSVHVNELMVIERYSHVMHIVSDVTGTIRPDCDAFDLFRACHPAGTVSGAPKVRAMQIIDELESTRRGSYAGSVGLFSRNGDLDTCIAIRTVYIKDGRAYVQAGSGLVYDSQPDNEYRECRNKAQAALTAIRVAQGGLEG